MRSSRHDISRPLEHRDESTEWRNHEANYCSSCEDNVEQCGNRMMKDRYLFVETIRQGHRWREVTRQIASYSRTSILKNLSFNFKSLLWAILQFFGELVEAQDLSHRNATLLPLEFPIYHPSWIQNVFI
jgi:hypothetical protein